MRLVLKTLIGVMAVATMVAVSGVKAEACSVPANLKQLRFGVSGNVNKKRLANGRVKLNMRPALNAAAQQHACWMADNNAPLSHKGIRGTYVQHRVRAQGYNHRYINENVGGGTIMRPMAFVQAWWNSPVHKANILARQSRHIGVGIADARGWRYWVMVTGVN
jgi:uncharacterized protein YkwD